MGMMSLTRETGTVDVLHTVVRDEELLLPAHEHSPAVESVFHRQMRLVKLVLDMSERREPPPVNHVLRLGRAPVARQETIPTANDLGVKVRRKLWPVVCESTNAEVPAQVG